jgi:hypothetical protein
MPSFNIIHIHRYISGVMSQAQILALYPQETITTLTVAVAARKATVTSPGYVRNGTV